VSAQVIQFPKRQPISLTEEEYIGRLLQAQMDALSMVLDELNMAWIKYEGAAGDYTYAIVVQEKNKDA